MLSSNMNSAAVQAARPVAMARYQSAAGNRVLWRTKRSKAADRSLTVTAR